jgi:hypothetical protein
MRIVEAFITDESGEKIDILRGEHHEGVFVKCNIFMAERRTGKEYALDEEAS